MKNYIIFILLLIGAYAATVYYRKIAFRSLMAKRSLSKNKLFPGEVFKINIHLENRKLLPVSFLNVEELMPREVQKKFTNFSENRGELVSYNENYTIGARERVKRSYEAFINKRGVYFLRNMDISIVDFLGINKEVKQVEDFLEIVVYPKLKSFSQKDIASNSILGDLTVKRWIYKDPIFVKGIREYTSSDRMKDIHWNSSLKGGRMMVKDYDYTSDKEAVLVINVQFTRPFWNGIKDEYVNKSCEIAASLAESFLKQGVAVGVWSNAHIISHNGDLMDKILPSLNNMNNILEFCGRIDNTPRHDFYDYFKENIKFLNTNGVYVIITGYLPEDVQELLKASARRGYTIKLIDISKNNVIPELSGIEKLNVREEF